MTKAEFVQEVRSALGEDTTLESARKAIDAVFGALADTVVRTGEFRRQGFGTWRLQQLPAREVRNPQTGERMKIGARTKVAFKAAQALRDRVQPPEPKGKGRKKGG